jgi:IclR family transcriptional regulator, KDG regulon repressor
MRRRLNSVNNVVDILEAFAFAAPSWTVSDLARRTGLSKASTHTLLANLEARSIIEKDQKTSIYSVGIHLWKIGIKVTSSNKLPTVCDPWLRRLRDQSAESCYLAIYDHGEALYVGKAESENPIQAYTVLGARGPCNCTASGKVLLAAQPDAEVVRVLSGPLTAHTATTITDPAEARKMIAKVRRQGYALSNGEWRSEVQSVAVPLLVHSQTSAALCITGPAYRFKASRALALVEDLRRAVNEIQAAIGMDGAAHARSRSAPDPAAPLLRT